MIEGASPVLQAFLGTLFTWGMTACGAATVFLIPPKLSETLEIKILDCSLGFGAGVMLAASYWSLLAPALELAEEMGYAKFTFVPAVVGVFLGMAFVVLAERCLPHSHHNVAITIREENEGIQLQIRKSSGENEEQDQLDFALEDQNTAFVAPLSNQCAGAKEACTAHTSRNEGGEAAEVGETDEGASKNALFEAIRRTHLLVVAVTLHNFPEGLAVGVGFGSIGNSPSATFGSAVALAIGIGIQNFPEGMAVALPLRRIRMSKCKSFLAGQSSGMVEPIGGLIGAAGVIVARPILPYAMAFAAGAMIYVVIFAIIPEVASRGNLQIASRSAILGFIVMMTLDVVLG